MWLVPLVKKSEYPVRTEGGVEICSKVDGWQQQ